MFKYIVFILFLVASTVSYNCHSKILLRDVEVLTLKNGLMTTGRRSQPVKQMDCVGGSARKDSYKVDTIQCKNVGFDGYDVNWKCEAVVTDFYKLGKTEVYCEGFDYPEDPYILVGSCGVEYELDYTDKYYESLKPKPKPLPKNYQDKETVTTKTVITTTTEPIFNEFEPKGYEIVVVVILVIFFMFVGMSW